MAGRKNQSSVEKHDVVGYFLPDLSGSVQDDLDEDADPEDDDYLDLDMEEMEYGGGMPGTNCLVNKTVQFQVFNQTHPLTVTGRFIMDMFDPWWKVTVQVRRNRSDRKFMVRGTFAAYELRDDNGVHRDHIMELFLSKCCKGDDTQFKDEFLNYVRNNKITLNFTNILEYLEKFRMENPAVAELLLKLVNASGVLQAANLKNFFKFIPQLLPRRFDYLCGKKQRQGNPVSAETRSAIDLALEEEPWILGFSTIMFNHFKVVGCEASLDALKNCGLYDKMPSKYKDALSIYHVLKADCRQFGHTYIVESGGKSVESGLAYAGLTISSFKDAYEFLTSNGIVKRETKNRQKRVYLYRLWKSEVSITETVDKLIQEPPWSFTIDFDSSPVFASLKGDPDQMRAARMMSENAVTVLSGKGGCGKTHVVGAVFKYAENLIMEENLKKFETDFPEDDDDISLSQAAAECEKNYNLSQQNKDNATSGPSIPSNQQPESSQPKKIPDSRCCILLTAPTGKASKVLQKRAQLPAYTLHSINASFSNWNMQPKECRDPWNFSKVRALIVDECSLVSVQLISTTLNIMQEHADLRKVIFIGDVKQLPSIDPGNFLYDMYNSLDKLGYSVTLKKNHRSGVDLIVKNATLISNRQWPEFNEEQNFHLIEVEGDQVIDIETAVNELLRNKDSPLQNHEISQFVAFRRKDCSSINDLCSRHYNNHTTHDDKKRLRFRVGDKVCCTRNHIVVDHSEHPKEKKDDIDFSNTHADAIASTSNISNNETGPLESAENSKQAKEREKQDKKIKLYNGEVFFIREDIELIDNNTHRRFLVLDDLERKIKVDFKEVMRECKLQHAWARTIHTYQGSESEVIVYVVGSSYRQTWQHVYTAVTRGKHNVFIITQCEELYNAIQNIPYKRYTSLKERMEELVNKILKEKPYFKVPLAGGDAYNQQRSATSSNLTNTKPWMAAETEEESQEFEFSEEFDQVDNSRHSSESRGSTDNRAISYSSTKGKGRGKSSSENQPHASTLNPGLRSQTVNGSGINFNLESILVSSHFEPKDILNGSDSQNWAGLDDSDYDKLALMENEAILSLSQQGSANQVNASTRNSAIRNIDFSGDKEKIISSQMATEENRSSDETDSQCTQTPSHYLSETDSLSTQTPSQYLLDDKNFSTQESSQVVECYDDVDSNYVMEFSDNEGVIVMKGEHDETIIVGDDDGTEDDMLSDDSESILTSATQPGYLNNSDSKSRPELNNVELTGDNMGNSSQESQSLLCCNHNRLETEDDDSEESQSILTHNLRSSSPSRKCLANTKYSPGKRESPENSSSGLPYKKFNSQGSVSPLAKGIGKFRIKDDKKSYTQ